MVLTIPQWHFHFLTFPAAICHKSIFSYSADWRHAITVSAKEPLSTAFHAFLYSLLNGCILIFLRICPYFALSFPLALNTTPLLELCFMRCDSEVWLPRQAVWTKALHSAGCDRVWGGLKLTSPLYSASYTGTAFVLLSWQGSAELEKKTNKR